MKTLFTNGCFDIIHAGHIQLLRYLKTKYNCKIIVGINTDESIKRLKGPNRPINTLSDRIEVLMGIKYIDDIIAFEDDTPIRLIKSIEPDILAKGGDRKNEIIVGEEFVKSYGGIVDKEFFLNGHSSSRLINILNKNNL